LYQLAFSGIFAFHWGVENRLHWVMDVVFHDDLMRLRTESGLANMAIIRHAAMNIIKQINDKANIEVCRKTLRWDDKYLLNAIASDRGGEEKGDVHQESGQTGLERRPLLRILEQKCDVTKSPAERRAVGKIRTAGSEEVSRPQQRCRNKRMGGAGDVT
jgi:hypothetical protein